MSNALVYSKMPPQDLISVVVTTYNRSDALRCVVQSLARQNDRDFEVVVADDGSQEAHQQVIRAALKESGLQSSHVWHPDLGFTASQVRNLGVAAARGNYIIFLDGDCVCEVDFVQRHRRLREAGYFVNGSRVMLAPELTQRVVQQQADVVGRGAAYWLGAWASGDASKFTATWRLPDLGLRRMPGFVWKGIRSCNMGVWRADFEAVNGFDESFVGWGHEDADFVLRLHNQGLQRKNGFLSTEVYHLWHPESSRSAESDNAQRVRERMHSRQVQASKGFHESQGDPDVVVHRWG